MRLPVVVEIACVLAGESACEFVVELEDLDDVCAGVEALSEIPEGDCVLVRRNVRSTLSESTCLDLVNDVIESRRSQHVIIHQQQIFTLPEVFINVADLSGDAEEVSVFRLKDGYGAEIALPDAAACGVGKICVMCWISVVCLLKNGVVQREGVDDVGIFRVDHAGAVECADDGGDAGFAEYFLRDEGRSDSADEDFSGRGAEIFGGVDGVDGLLPAESEQCSDSYDVELWEVVCGKAAAVVLDEEFACEVVEVGDGVEAGDFAGADVVVEVLCSEFHQTICMWLYPLKQ